MDHSPGFLRLVEAARSRIQEVTVGEAKARVEARAGVVLLDVREDHEWAAGHAEGAVHLGKGILERDLEKRVPAASTEIIMYCGGGFRSALTADAARQMGYLNVRSLAGGYRALVASGWPIVR